MLRRTLIMTGLAIAFAAGAADPAFAAENTATASPVKVAETRAALRDLWSEHVFRVRNVVWATLEKNQSAGAAAEAQVVANARQIADSIAPFYGKPAADQLFELLKGHYGPIRQYLDASIANDAAGRDRAQKALSANAGAIAIADAIGDALAKQFPAKFP